MKKITATLALALASVLSAAGGPLNTRGIPANAGGVVHLDVAAAAQSGFGKLVFGQFAEAAGLTAPARYEQLKKDLGFDPSTDLGDITVGLVNAGAKGGVEAKACGVVIVRGNFSSAKWLAGALAKKTGTVKKIGAHTFVDAASSAKLLPFAAGQKVMVGPAGENALLLADADILEAVVASLDDAKLSYAPPSGFVQFAAQVGSPLLVAQLSDKVFPPPPPPAPSAYGTDAAVQSSLPAIWLALGESGADIRLRFSAEYATAADAQKGRASFQTLLMFWGVKKRPPDASDDPAKKEFYARVDRLSDAIKFAGEQRTFAVSLDYPSADAIWLVKKLASPASK
jgi:hypothetical protein